MAGGSLEGCEVGGGEELDKLSKRYAAPGGNDAITRRQSLQFCDVSYVNNHLGVHAPVVGGSLVVVFLR